MILKNVPRDVNLAFFDVNAALPHTEYPLRILKFEIRAEITEYDANERGGACTKRCLCESVKNASGSLRMLRLIAIHTTEFSKMPYECSERLQMPLQIKRTSCNHLTNEANV